MLWLDRWHCAIAKITEIVLLLLGSFYYYYYLVQLLQRIKWRYKRLLSVLWKPVLKALLHFYDHTIITACSVPRSLTHSLTLKLPFLNPSHHLHSFPPNKAHAFMILQSQAGFPRIQARHVALICYGTPPPRTDSAGESSHWQVGVPEETGSKVWRYPMIWLGNILALLTRLGFPPAGSARTVKVTQRATGGSLFANWTSVQGGTMSVFNSKSSKLQSMRIQFSQKNNRA